MIPDFQSLMLPLLNLIADEQEHSSVGINTRLAHLFDLSEDELDEYLPSGTQKKFGNRVAWAKAHLKFAGFIENTKRGYFKISPLGKKYIDSHPKELNIKILKKVPTYLEAIGKGKEEELISHQAVATPEEILESSFARIRKNLAHELLSKIKKSSPAFFENLVIELLVKMGYGGTMKEAGRSVGRSKDEGIDGIIKEDRLGLDVIYIQAKRWENPVGRPEIQKFVGALAGQGAKKGIFITTARFTNDARAYHPKNETKIVLIDGEELANLMIDYNLAVSTIHTFEIKRIDNDYFGEE
jgi:restriction system protein